VIVHADDPEHDPCWPPGVAVAVYERIGEPPLLGAVKVTVACVSPETAVTFEGALGIVAGVTLLLAVEAVPAPFKFVAVTVKV
jgi:hypothetical protein